MSPAHEFRAHNAPLGMVFLRHHNHRLDYRGAALVALHGSWNRTKKDGYKLVSLHFDMTGAIEERDFLTGFLADDTAIGRPADVAEGPDGSIYVSDDFGSAVYRITFGERGEASVTVPTSRFRAGYDPTAISRQERETALAVGPVVLASEGCFTCHIESTARNSPQIPLNDLRARYSLDGLMDYLATPPPPMPPYDADRSELRALAIYLLESY